MSVGPAPATKAGRHRAFDPVRATVVAAPLLALAAWGYIIVVEQASVGELFSAQTRAQVADFVGALIGLDTALVIGEPAPRFLDLGRWGELAGLAVETLAMSLLAIWLSVIGMLATVMVGARRSRGRGATGVLGWVAGGIVRGVWVVSRSVPELVWALLLVFLFPPGVLAGAAALGIHNFGIVGRLCAEVVEDLDPRPARALRAAGARRGQVLAYAVLPQALPQFLTYSLYRWEVIIRTTIVVGFVAAGGLGGEFRLAMSFFRYTDVAMVLVTYFVLVVLVDLVAAQLRRLAA